MVSVWYPKQGLKEGLDESYFVAETSPAKHCPKTCTTVVKTLSRCLDSVCEFLQMRSVIQIFNNHFPNNTGKWLLREKKNRKWVSYKNRIYQEYKAMVEKNTLQKKH